MSLDIDALIDRRQLKRRLTFWRIAATLAVVALGVILARQFAPQTMNPYVARVSIDGIIVENRDMIDALKTVAEDDNAKALVVRIDSPGGTTTGSENLYHALRKVAAKKPVVTVMGTLAASGGYVTAIAADHIIARETTITGSIGVIMEYTQAAGLLEKVGVTMETIKSGELKGEPSLAKPLSPQGRQVLQSMIDDSYAWFTELVAARRKMPLDKVKLLADGRAYTGRQAFKAGLVDQLGGEDDARTWLATTKNISADLPDVDMDETPEERLFGSFLSSLLSGTFGNMRLPLDGMTAIWQPNP